MLRVEPLLCGSLYDIEPHKVNKYMQNVLAIFLDMRFNTHIRTALGRLRNNN